MSRAYFKWKEELVYEDDDGVLVFEAPMGVSPHPVYVPTADVWSSKVPAWAKDKREQVLGAIRAVPGVGDVIEDASAWVSVRA